MTRLHLTTPAALLALVVLAPAGPAGAQTPPASQPAAAPSSQPGAVARAKALYDEGQIQYRIGNFERALALYKQALELAEKPTLIFNIAQCHFQLKQWHKALFHYRHYLAIWAKLHPDRPAPNLSGVHTLIARVQLILEQEKQKARKETPIVVKPSTTVVIKDGGGKKAPEKPRHALLRIGGLTISGARVLVDGKLKAVAPIDHLLEVEPGVRKVAVEAKGYLPWRQEVNAVLGKESLVPVDLEPVPERSRLWLGLTVSTLILAAGAEAMAVVFHVQAEQHIAETKAFNDDKDMVTLGHALAGGLVALSALPLYFYITSNRVEVPDDDADKEQPAPPVSASFAPLPGGGIAVGQLRF
jgi:tetratricopeptide (TPR) repeat protein